MLPGKGPYVYCTCASNDAFQRKAAVSLEDEFSSYFKL